jgi:hypothetical protein
MTACERVPNAIHQVPEPRLISLQLSPLQPNSPLGKSARLVGKLIKANFASAKRTQWLILQPTTRNEKNFSIVCPSTRAPFQLTLSFMPPVSLLYVCAKMRRGRATKDEWRKRLRMRENEKKSLLITCCVPDLHYDVAIGIRRGFSSARTRNEEKRRN